MIAVGFFDWVALVLIMWGAFALAASLVLGAVIGTADKVERGRHRVRPATDDELHAWVSGLRGPPS